MSRLARRRGHAGSCPTRLGRGAIRGAAKKQTPTRVPRRASLAFGVHALVMQDGEIAARGWRAICRRARRETHLGGRGDGGLRREHLGGRRHGGAEGQGRGHRVCVCTDATVCPPSPRGAFVARTRDAPLAWPRGSSLLVDAIHLGVADETAKRFRGRDFLNPERRVRASRPNRKGAPFTSRLARDDRSGNSVIPPRYPFKRVAKPRFEANPGELFRVACEPTPQHRRTGPHRRTSHHGEEEHQVQGQGQGGAGACPATRRSRVRMPVLILSRRAFLISRPRLANARRRGTAGPARDAIGARRAAGVGTARPRRRRSPAPLHRKRHRKRVRLASLRPTDVRNSSLSPPLRCFPEAGQDEQQEGQVRGDAPQGVLRVDRRGERRARRRRGQARCRYVPPRDAQRDDRRTPRALSSRSSRRARAEKSHPASSDHLSFSFFVRAGAWAKILADDALKAQL